MSNTVLVIDDHPLIREGIKKSLSLAEFDCIGEAASSKEAIAMIALLNPEIITVDINLPDGHGLEIVLWARKHSTKIIIIVLSLDNGLNLIAGCISSGANAFVSKSEPISHVISAIRSAQSNPAGFTSSQMVDVLKRNTHTGLLTGRELSVLAHLDGPESNEQIAAAMFISHATVKTHIGSIYRKLDVRTRRAAILRAGELGLI